MACYTFTIGNREFKKVSSPNIEGETSLQNFIRAVSTLKESDPKSFEIFQSLLKAQYQSDNIIRPDSRQNSNIPYKIKENLKRFGIEMEVLSKEDWIKFCNDFNKDKKIGIDKNSKSFFLDGTIYVRKDGFSVGDSIHELSHLILAVMRGMDFGSYQRFIHTFYQHPGVQKISKQLTEFGSYSNNYDLDFEEESVVRYLEGIFTGQEEFIPNFKVNNTVLDTMQFINDSLKNPIIATFGITEFPGINTIFKSLLSDIPIFGSEMFVHRDISSTGYKEMKQKAIESEGIKALIDFYSSKDGGNIIEKGECL